MRDTDSNYLNLACGVALLSASLISYQVLLINILSISQWYHFAYMVISIALLGFGTAGTILSIFKEQLLREVDIVIPSLIIISALFMVGSLSLSQLNLFYFDSFKIFFDFKNSLKLIFTCIIFFLPFLFGALAIGLAFIGNVKNIGILYFANMTGSGVGGIIVILMLWISSPEKLTIVISAVVLISAIISMPKTIRSKFVIILILVFSIIASVYLYPPVIKTSEYKALSRSLSLADSRILKKDDSPYGRLQILYSPSLRYAPGLSAAYRGNISASHSVYNNGNWLGPMVDSTSDFRYYFRSSTEYLPYLFGRKNNILILNAGTGRYIKHALWEEIDSVIAVEPHLVLLDLLSEKFSHFIDSVYTDPNVKIQDVSPRTFLQSADEEFDLIQLPIIDAFGGSSGMYALHQHHLLTKEAFSEMYSLLNNSGLISVSTWIDYPYKNPLKLISTISESLCEYGIENISSHIIGIKNWNNLTLVVKKTPFNNYEVNAVRSFCKKMNFDPLVLEGIVQDDRDYYNKLQDKSFYKYVDLLIGSQENRNNLYDDYTFNIRPATDNKPYFSQFLKFSNVSKISETFGENLLPYFEIGYFLLYLTFIQIIILAILLIILPLFKLNKNVADKKLTHNYKKRGFSLTLFYFSGLGLGYMFFEMLLIHKFTLYLGNIVYSASAVLSLMLVSSGLGSLVSQKFEASPKYISRIIFTILIFLTVNMIIILYVLKTTVVFGLALKILFTLIIISPAAFLMGMPFPLGLRFLSVHRENQIPWAWGINGLFSVIGALGATIISVELGFITVMVSTAAAYSICLLSIFRVT